MESKIDIVIPYVDCTDRNWQELFKKYNNSSTIDEEINGESRFRGQGDFFKYMFRGIDKFLPFINNVFLVVQSESQVPEWLDRSKIKVVYHDQFMPKEFLPTFNSTAIEMFIWNIPGLSEQFIYTNDDVMPVGPLKATSFFTDGKCRTNGRFCGNLETMYGHHIVNSYELVYESKNTLGKVCIGFSHLPRPLLKSKCKECFLKYQDKILSSITRFRDEKNFNVYIYDNYMIRNTKTLPRLDLVQRTITGCMTDAEIEKGIKGISKEYNIINICDSSDGKDIYKVKCLNDLFSKTFPIKSKYEK